MNSSNQSRFVTLLYFGAVVTAVAVAFLVGYWQIRPGTADQFTRLLNIGKNYYEQGNTARAIEAFDKALALHPAHPDVLINLANSHLLAGKPDEAIRYAREIIRVEPNSAGAHYVIGCARLRLFQFEEAVKELQIAKEIDQKVNAVSFQLGRAYQGWGKFEEAAEEFREVIQFEDHAAPAYAVSYYNLGQVLVRLGQTDQANEMLNEYQKIIAGRSNRPADATALERCIYTQARVPFQLAQPDSVGVKVAFANATTDFFGTNAMRYQGPIGLLDVNHRGSNDLFVAEGDRGFRLLLNSNATFQAQEDLWPSIPEAHYTRCLVGDLNNDRYEDLIMIGDKGIQAFRFATNGAAIDATAFSNLKDTPAVDGALVDLDFTGKLDLLLISPKTNQVRLLRNLGNMYFKDTTSTSGIPAALTTARQLTIEDWNHDDIMDVFVTRRGQAPLLLLKERGGALTNNNANADWPVAAALAVGDLNNDLRNDSIVATPAGLEYRLSGTSNWVRAAAGDFSSASLSLVDYDNDGWLDICTRGNGVRIWRNLGQAGFRETTAELGLDKIGTDPIDQIALADFDNDGDTDFLLSIRGRGLQLWRNNGGNANQQLKLRLVGNRSNSSGLGVRIELSAGHWQTIRTVTELPIEIGVGPYKQLDSVNIHWVDVAAPSAEVPVDPRTPLSMIELLLPTGSCPYLYAWDGQQFRFVTDILGAAPAGLPVAEGRMIEADPDEYVRIGNADNFRPKEGAYLLRITEELREVLYLDEAKLVIADHPEGTEVHPTDKLLPGKPFPPSELIAVEHRYPLRRATNLEGADVTDLVRENDGQWLSPAKLRIPQLRGLAEPHGMVLDFGPLDVARPLVLVLSGWLRFGGGTANIAASHDPNLPFPFPTMEAETAEGLWIPVDVSVGAPAGKTKTILVELAGKLPGGCRRLKLTMAFEIHWDRVALFERSKPALAKFTSLSPTRTELRWRGFSDFQDLPWFLPLTPQYDTVKPAPNWLITPSGWCTRYGPVDELIAKSDDALALINGGDELALAFGADQLPPLAPGHLRDFFLYSVGWDKDSDFHVLAGTTVEPLPFHGMDDQRYGQMQPCSSDRGWWTRKYNTRWVGPHVVHPQSPRQVARSDPKPR